MDEPQTSNLCLGLIGGLGVGATIHYYEALVKGLAEKSLAPRLLIVHADMRRVVKHVTAGETRLLAQYFAELIAQLASGGAQVAAIPAITPQICAPELVPLSLLPLVDPIEETARVIHQRGFRRVALLGTRFVIESKLFGRLPGVEVIPLAPDDLERMHSTYFRLASEGAGLPGDYDYLRALAWRLVEKEGCEAVVLAGTDLSVLFNPSNTDFPHIDCTRVHVDALLKRMTGDL